MEKAKRRDSHEKTHYFLDIPPYSRWMCDHERNTTTRVWGETRCFQRIVGKNRRRPDANHVKYRLIKQDDTYGLYFYRIWHRGKKKTAEWKNWTINGKEILGEPRKFGVKIFVQGKDVYFTIRALDKPAKMSRVEE
jgi:hypothetical protein